MKTIKNSYLKKIVLSSAIASLVFFGSCGDDDDTTAAAAVQNEPPAAPTLSTPTNGSDDVDPSLSIVLSWEEAIDPDGDAVAYFVYFDTDTSSWTGTSAGTITSYTPSGITGLTKYFWKVEARDVNNAATSSETWSFTTINVSEDKATITWTSGDGASNGDAGTMTDLRDVPAKSYGIKVIAGSVWMTENLAFLPEVHPASDVSDGLARYYVYGYDGTDVAEAKLATIDTLAADWNGDGSQTTDAINSFETFGALYNLKTIDTGCPSGWHVANAEEWSALLVANGWPSDTLDLNYEHPDNSWIPGMIAEAESNPGNVGLYIGWPIFYYYHGENTGVKLADKSTWLADPSFEFVYPIVTDPTDEEQAEPELNQQNGIALMASNASSDRNLSGFSAKAAGYVSGEGAAFTSLGSLASFWSSSEGEDGPMYINLDAEMPGAQKFAYEEGGSPGLSLRCVLDQE